MLNFKKRSQILILSILIIICAINTNFFKSVYLIIQNKVDDRITSKYNFCGEESVGFLLHIKKKYQIKDNPKIINYIHTPPVSWTIINTKKLINDSKKLILLNYPGPELIMNLKKHNNNLFEFTDVDFFNAKFDKIKSIELIDDSNNLKKIDSIIDINVVDNLRNKKNIKSLNIKDTLDINSKIKLDIVFNDLIINEKKLYLQIDNEDMYDFSNLQIRVVLKNKYILKDFKIIDKTANCYYVE